MSNKEVFSKIYKEDLWHGGSGAGSKLENVKEYVEILQKYIDKPEVKTVLDLGCGDWQFSKFLDLSSVLYLGVDVVDSVIDSNINLYSASNIDFISRDITTYELPQVDLIICKDVLQHLCNKDVASVLVKIIKSSKFALITNDF
jgi:2-polyprenyl-3-methyl-5-hydroxy-6-metoxy-1,4-benzoquinol methylase